MLCDILHATCQTRVFFHFHIHVIGTNHFFYLYISGRRCSWYTTMDCGYLYALSTMLWMMKLETSSAIQYAADKLYHNMPYQPHLVKRNNVTTIVFGYKSNILLLIYFIPVRKISFLE